MNKQTYLIVLLILIFFYSCSTKENDRTQQPQKAVSDVELVASKEVSFVLNNEASLKTSFIQAISVEGKDSMLMYLNDQKPAIYFYDLADQSLVKELSLEKEGPNAVGTPNGLYFHNMDSIYVISSSYYKVTLVNSRGEALKSYRLINGSKPNESTGMLRPFTIAPPYVIDEKMYFNVAPDRDVYDESYFDGKVNLVLDLNSEEFNYYNHFPREFQEGVWGVAAVNFSSAYNHSSNKVVYSFSISDSLYVQKTGTSSLKSYVAKTHKLDSKQEPMANPDNQHDLQYALNATYYDGIIFDSYRNVYYRFVRQPLELEKNVKHNFYDFHRKPISVIILDSDFKKIGETHLEDDIYQSFMYFVTPQGLFVSKGNPNNPNLKENEAAFTCFKLQDNRS